MDHKVTVIQIVTSVLGTISKELVKGLGRLASVDSLSAISSLFLLSLLPLKLASRSFDNLDYHITLHWRFPESDLSVSVCALGTVS